MLEGNYHMEFGLSHPAEFTKEELDAAVQAISLEFTKIYAKHPDFNGKASFYFKLEIGKKEDFEG